MPAKKANKKLFVEEYLKDLNAKQAAIRAGFGPKTARVTGPRMVKQLAAEIQAAQDARSFRTGVTNDRIIEELARIAFSDPRKLFHRDGTLRSVVDLDDDSAAALSGVEISTAENGASEDAPRPKDSNRLTKSRSWDKVKALELLGKHNGMFKDQVEHAGAVTFVIER